RDRDLARDHADNRHRDRVGGDFFSALDEKIVVLALADVDAAAAAADHDAGVRLRDAQPRIGPGLARRDDADERRAGVALRVGALAFGAWVDLFVLGRSLPPAGWRPLIFDVLLFSIFALHHSVFARDFARVWLGMIPAGLHRSVYVWVASLLLIVVCLLWRPI